MSSIYSMVDGNVSGAIKGGTEEKATKHAEKLFKLIDLDGDGNLTENEFIRVSSNVASNLAVPSRVYLNKKPIKTQF